MPTCAQIDQAVNSIWRSGKRKLEAVRASEGPCAHLRGRLDRRGLHLVGLDKCVDGIIHARKNLKSQAAVKRIVAEHKRHFSRPHQVAIEQQYTILAGSLSKVTALSMAGIPSMAVLFVLVPVKDHGQPHLAMEWGGTALGGGTSKEMLESYISNAKRWRT